MKVTRDVIYDLLPGYFAGELSSDAKALVDEFFATDAEFARMAERFRTLFNERRAGTGDTGPMHEKQVYERARSFRTARDRALGMAIGFSAGALLALFVGALFPLAAPSAAFGFMRLPPVLIAIAFGGIALGAWITWLIGRIRGGGRHAVLVACACLTATAPTWAQDGGWRDPSPHDITFVTVDDDVRLEVLDWGGSGPTVLLLAGLGDTAHVFDDFAPILTSKYRVLAITRRAHGRSSAPSEGYTFERLAEDIVRVIDTARLDRPIVVGHSFAGEEMHLLGARYPARIAGLVYIDSAFNRADGSEGHDAVARTLPAAPRPGRENMVSFAALRAFLERTGETVGPEAHLRARWIANADGTIARAWTPTQPVLQAMAREIQSAYKAYNPEQIRVPALAIYAVPKSAADLLKPWYNADDPVVRERVETLYRLARERFARHAKWFEAFAERGEVVELAGPHHLFISNASGVAALINALASSLSKVR